MQPNRDAFLDRMFATYRELLGDYEPTPAFTALVWRRIEARKAEGVGWAAYLFAWAPRLAFGSLVLAVLLLLSNWVQPQDTDSIVLDSTYVDALALDSMDEDDEALWVLAENGQ